MEKQNSPSWFVVRGLLVLLVLTLTIQIRVVRSDSIDCTMLISQGPQVAIDVSLYTGNSGAGFPTGIAVAQNCVWANSVSLTFDFTYGPSTLLLRNLTFNGPNSSLYLLVGSSAASSVEADGIVGSAMGDVLVVKSAAGSIVQNFALQLRNSRIRAAGSVATIAEASVVKNVSISIASSTLAVVTSLPWANATVSSIVLSSSGASTVTDSQLTLDATTINMTCTSSCSVLSVHTSSFAGASKLSLVNVGLSASKGPSSVSILAQTGCALFLSALGSQVSILDSVWIGNGFDAALQATSTGLILGVAGGSTVAMKNCTVEGRGFRGRLNVTGSQAVTGAVLGAVVHGVTDVSVTVNNTVLTGSDFTVNSTIRTDTGFTSVAALLGVGAVSARFPSFATVSNSTVSAARFIAGLMLNSGGNGAAEATTGVGAIIGVAAGAVTAKATAAVMHSTLFGEAFASQLLVTSNGGGGNSASSTAAAALLGSAAVSSTFGASSSLTNVSLWGTDFSMVTSSLASLIGYSCAASSATAVLGTAAASPISTAAALSISSTGFGCRFNGSAVATASAQGKSNSAASSSVLGLAAGSTYTTATTSARSSTFHGCQFNTSNNAKATNGAMQANAAAAAGALLGMASVTTTAAPAQFTVANSSAINSTWSGVGFNGTNSAEALATTNSNSGAAGSVLGLAAASTISRVTPTVTLSNSTLYGSQFTATNTVNAAGVGASSTAAAAAALGLASVSPTANSSIAVAGGKAFGEHGVVVSTASTTFSTLITAAASTFLGVVAASADTPVVALERLLIVGSAIRANNTATANTASLTAAATAVLGVAVATLPTRVAANASFLTNSVIHGTDFFAFRGVSGTLNAAMVLGVSGVKNVDAVQLVGCKAQIEGSTSAVGIIGANASQGNIWLTGIDLQVTLSSSLGQCFRLAGQNYSDSFLLNSSGNCSSYGPCDGCQTLNVRPVINGTMLTPTLLGTATCPTPPSVLMPLQRCIGSQCSPPTPVVHQNRSSPSRSTRSPSRTVSSTTSWSSTFTDGTSSSARTSGLTATHFTHRVRPPSSAPNSSHKSNATRTNTYSRIPVRVPERRTLPTATSTIATLLGSTTAAKAVVGVGTASTALTGLVSPTTAGGAIRVGSVASVVDCEFSDDDTDPSYLDLPIQTVIGSGKFSAFAGSALASALVLLVIPSAALTAVAFAGRRWPAEGRRLGPFQRRIVSNVVFMALGYIGPNIVYSFVLVSAHDGNANENLSVIVATLVVALAIITVAFVIRRFAAFFRSAAKQKNTTIVASELEVENLTPNSMMFESFGTTFDAARSTAGIVRVYFLEELLVSILLQSLSGIRPRSGLCGPVAASMAVVAAFHVLYLILVRPYASRLELGFSVVGAVLLLVMSLFAVLVTFLGRSRTVIDSLAVVTLLQNILFFVQAAVMAVVVLARHHRRRLEHSWTPKDTIEEGGEPLLMIADQVDGKREKDAVDSGVEEGTTFAPSTSESELLSSGSVFNPLASSAKLNSNLQ